VGVGTKTAERSKRWVIVMVGFALREGAKPEKGRVRERLSESTRSGKSLFQP
jgi:hypothetical protein